MCPAVQTLSDSLWFFTIYNYHDVSGFLCKSNDQMETYTILSPFGAGAFYFLDSLHAVSTDSFSLDGGLSWQASLISGGGIGGNDICFIDSLHGWQIGNYHVLKTNDGGLSWTTIFQSPSWPDFQKIQFTDSLNGFIITGSFQTYKMYKSSDGGNNWSELNLPFEPHDFHFIDSLHGWISSEGIFYTSDGGNTFSIQDSHATKVITFIDSGHVYAGGRGIFLQSDQTNIIDAISILNSEPFNLNVYPIPSPGKITISSDKIISGIQIFDLSGVLVFSDQEIHGRMAHVNLHSIAKGNYIVQIQQKNQTICKKIVIN